MHTVVPIHVPNRIGTGDVVGCTDNSSPMEGSCHSINTEIGSFDSLSGDSVAFSSEGSDKHNSAPERMVGQDVTKDAVETGVIERGHDRTCGMVGSEDFAVFIQPVLEGGLARFHKMQFQKSAPDSPNAAVADNGSDLRGGVTVANELL